MDKNIVVYRLNCISDYMSELESELPYDYKQHDPNKAFLAEIRQQVYSIRRTLGSLIETVKDERNWGGKL